MNWLNLNISETLRSPEYVGSSPAERGAWLSVHAYAATIECGGVLVGAASWKDRQWQQSAGVTLREIKAASKLLAIDGDDVVIFGYNVTKQEQVKASRVAGAIGAKARWSMAPAMPPATETPLAPANAEGKEKGKEGEGNEKHEEGCAGSADSPAASPTDSPKPPKTPKPPALSDAEWLAGLTANAAYDGINIAREHGRMCAWCENKRKQPTRARFLNWLNRCDRPMTGGLTALMR